MRNGTATFANGPANLLNNEPKNPPDWISLEMWALESFISVDILLLKAFLSFVFCLVVSSLVVSNNSWGRSFPSNIFELILKVVPVLFLTAVFSFVSCVFVNFTFIYCIQQFICNCNTFVVPLENCQTVSFFWLFESVVNYYSCIFYCWFYFTSRNILLNYSWISI